LTPTECTTIAATPKDHAKKAETRHENFKVVVHPDFSKQEITIRGTTEKQGHAPERAEEIQSKVQKLVEAGFMREVYYHDWLSNPVMVNSVPSRLVSIRLAPDPSIHDDPFVNSVHGSYGVSNTDASGGASSDFSKRKSAWIWPFTYVHGRMGCAWKYLRKLLTAQTSARTSFSIGV
nr:reverse transcriptase domain-containing protein [Tanacetum cinerariifolium]